MWLVAEASLHYSIVTLFVDDVAVFIYVTNHKPTWKTNYRTISLGFFLLKLQAFKASSLLILILFYDQVKIPILQYHCWHVLSVL